MRLSSVGLVLALVIGILGAPSVSFAQSAHPTFVAEMNGFEEVPGASTLASGFAGIQIGMNGQTVYYTLTVTDASTRLVAAHLHFAPPGEAGPVIVPLCSADSKPCQTEGVTQGSFTAADFTGPFANDGLDRLINEARNGMVYANVHSTKFASGEARGQLMDLGAMMHMTEPAMEEHPMNEPSMGH